MVAIHTPFVPADALARTGRVAYAAAPHDRAGHTEPGRQHAATKTVNVMLGPVGLGPLPTGQPTDLWSTEDEAPAFHFEAVFDPKQVSRTAAEEQLRAQLAARGLNVDRFLDEDGPCPVYPGWCAETGDHIDHSSQEFLIRSYDEIAEPLVFAGIVHLSDSQPYVSLQNESLSPAQAREKAQQLRDLADAMDAMATNAETARARAARG
ncbi:hypothetical protein ACIQCF_30105 [Streptomyces sp. NPDC088353]|uniref:hypothetical protein n=1 Tax=Streptomyces sp. NPDC088353 TaxID=3365855 RepID=UPI003810B7BD